ncbi:MAG: hypothetical protein ACRBB0_01840 [Pelagimonas sp.]|uniref:hypothetical protein n=1 Tax=Pelagimonas sp. TaxID=2073170 RepID=UPI003D6A93B4
MFSRFAAFQSLTIALFLTMATTQAAMAEPKMVVDLFGQTAQFRPPPWVNSRDLDAKQAKDFETARQNGKSANGTNFFLLEFIPKGESFSNWSQLYAITAETPLSGTVEAYLDGQIRTYKKACTKIGVQKLVKKRTNQVAVILCEAYRHQPSKGEIAVFSYVKTDKTLIKHYHHTRSKAFKLSNRTSIPLSSREVLDIADRLGDLKLTGG